MVTENAILLVGLGHSQLPTTEGERQGGVGRGSDSFRGGRIAPRLLVHMLTGKMQSGHHGVQQSLIATPTQQQQ